MLKDVDLIVKSESEVSVKARPSDGRAGGNAEIRGRIGPRGQFLLQQVPIVWSALKDLVRFAGQKGDRFGAREAGIEEGKPRALAENTGRLFRGECRLAGNTLDRMAFHSGKIPQSPPLVDVLLLEKSPGG